MLHLLEEFFASDRFWQQWQQAEKYERDGSTWVSCYLASHELALTFFEHEGLVKMVSVRQDDEVLISGLFFLNLEELTLLLYRVPAIRAANPYSTDSEQIRALSYASKTAR